ncbi:MAG TPA: hypothetical protein VFR58_07815, partial [Flavisolibacter sp.]|nr:hypothetical protein [Flavisolibacter sp.]
MKQLATLMLLLPFQFLFAQVRTDAVGRSGLPSGISYTGKFKSALRWKDSSGLHLLVVSETGVTSSKKDPDLREAALAAHHYLLNE